jgi:solute carrier family 25 phosphate transporter 3
MAAVQQVTAIKKKDYNGQVYMRMGLAGALCCSVTHTAVVPIDVVKTRLQVDPSRYKGMVDAFVRIPREEGARMLLKGAGPTTVGYFLQGAFKFGFNEYFKKQFSRAAGEQAAKQYRLPIWLGASACAEMIADMFLCPLEATRIRLVAKPDFAKGLVDGFGRILKQEGALAFYTGLPPLLFKQVPYTMAKFSVFEATSEYAYQILKQKWGLGPDNMTTGGKLSVSLASGLVAGVAAAVVSQPADTILSKVNQEKTDQGMIRAIAGICKRLGFKGLYLGMGARAIMVSTLTAGQFFIYDYCKILMGVSPQQLAAQGY